MSSRQQFLLPNVAPGTRVRLDTASGSTSAADVVDNLNQPISGSIITADSSGRLASGDVYGPAGVTTLYLKTLDGGGNVTATATLGSSHPVTGGADPRVDTLLSGAPGALDTLKELADALNDDASFAATMTTLLAGKENVVVHGSTAGTARPAAATIVHWIGSVAPTNGVTNDEWTDTTVPVKKRYSGSAWVSLSGASVTLADASNWTTATAYAVGDIVTQSGNRYIAKTAHTSGTFATDLAATKWTLLGAATAVQSVTSPDGSIAVGGTSTAPTLSGISASNLLLGTTQSVLKQPWGRAGYLGPELWATTYFQTTTINTVAGQTSLTPSLTGNGTTQRKYTRIRTGYMSSAAAGAVQLVFRFDFTLNSTVTSGWAGLAIRALTGSGATIAGTETYLWGTDGSATNYRSAIDITIPALNTNPAIYLEVEVFAYNNVSAGTVTLSAASLRQVASARPGLNVWWQGSNGPSAGTGTLDGLNVDVPVVDPVTGNTTWVRKLFAPDGMLRVNPEQQTAFYTGTYQHNYAVPSTTANSQANTTQTLLGSNRILHSQNTGQIMGVVKADASVELRCNTHGGEWGRTTATVTDAATTSGSNQITSATANFSLLTHGGATVTGAGIPQGTYISAVTNSTTATLSANATATATGVTVAFAQYAQNHIFELDFGDGTWVQLTSTNTAQNQTRMCRRVRITTHTQVTRSDQTTPFANVDNVYTIFDDGTVRFDRTITFLADQAMSQWFYFMHSFDTSVLQPGRMGYGQQVLTGYDPRQYLTTPAAPTVGNSATGGTYGSVTRTYSVTAITSLGESLASATAASTTASGTTNSFTVTLPSTQSGQTAWGIYDTTGLLAVVPVSVTTWTDTAPTYGTRSAPVASTASVSGGTQQYVQLMSDKVDWMSFYDQDVTKIAFGTVTDRDNALGYPGAHVLTAQLESHPGVVKQYWVLWDQAGYQPVLTPAQLQGSYTQTITNGTTLATTAYSFLYAPLDRTQWHREIAARGQGMKQFATVYPSA